MKILFLDIDGVVCLHEKDVVNWGEDAADDISTTAAVCG